MEMKRDIKSRTWFLRLATLLLCLILVLLSFPVYANEDLGTDEQKVIDTGEEQAEAVEEPAKNEAVDPATEDLVENDVPSSPKDDEVKLVYSLSSECDGCSVLVTNENGFDPDTVLNVEDIKKGSPLYDKYISLSVDLTDKSPDLVYSKILNMYFTLDGKEINPSGSVCVTITLDEKLSDVDVVHFEGKNEKPVIVSSQLSGKQITFETDSFSPYVIISGPDTENIDLTEPDKVEVKDVFEIENQEEPKAAPKHSVKSTRNSHESSDLVDFLSNVVITGATQNSNGEYVVEPNREYSLICSFAENSMHQFDNDAVLTYQMPAGVAVLSKQTGQLKINIVYKGRTYQVDASYDLDIDGTLEIAFDQNDPDYSRLVESTNVSFRFMYYASFDGNETHIRFSDTIERDLEFTDPDAGEVYATKTATYDEENGIFHYIVTVSATGEVEDVRVKDELLGNALVFNDDVNISGNSSSYTNNGSNSGFDYTFASMHGGEVITITYSASVDFTKDENNDGRITADQTKNIVTVDPEPGDPHTSEYAREIRFKYTVKNTGVENGVTSDGDKIIDWTIDYNPLALGTAAGDSIIDTIASDSVGYMRYYGNGIRVVVKDHDGNTVRVDDIAYGDLASYSSSSWKYIIPTTDEQPYSYHISYHTIVDMDAVAGTGATVVLNNTANESGGSISVTPENIASVNKEVDSYTTEQVTWISTLSIPQDGLTRAIVTDTVPARYFNGAWHYDRYKNDSILVTGLLEDEHYDVVATTSTVTVTFYYMENNVRKEGLKPFPGGRNVYVKLTTNVDEDWLHEGYDVGNLQTHMNTIDLNGISDTAFVIFGKPGVEKTGEKVDEDTFKYTILIKGLEQESFSLADTFDTNLLEVDTSKTGQSDHMYMYGGTQWSQIAGKTPVSYTDTTTGMNLVVNNVAKDATGKYYPYYMISYYLKLKDGVDLQQLAIANGGEYDLTNTASWAGHTDDFTYKVTYDYLTKELLNESELGGTYRDAQYRITFNSAKATLNNGEPITMTDVLSSNLSVDYSSIRIVTDPEGLSVPYSLKGGKNEFGVLDGTTVATYTIPDSTKVVITYNASVRGNGSQTITNTVSVLDDEETVVSTKDYGSVSEGEGAIASFKIVKVDGYDASKKLAGVRFKIFAENDELNFGERNDYAKEIILETDSNGEITLDGDQYDFYFNECYHVQEIDPLDGYGRIGFDYLVTLTADMAQVDYVHYVYYYSDSMQIKNWPLEGLVVEKQVESNNATDKDRYYTFRVSILNPDGTVNIEYNEVNGDDQFENGICEFQIKDKEQKMFWGFKKGTKYKVEEIDADGFVTSVKYDVFDANGHVVATNTDAGTSHTGELTQSDEVIVFINRKTDTIVPTGVGYRKDVLIVFSIFGILAVALLVFTRRRLDTDDEEKQ